MPRSSRGTRVAIAVSGVLALLGSLVAAAPAAADHTDEPAEVTLVGSLQDELGCDEDWLPGCPATELTSTGQPGVFSAVFDLPAGSYSYKVALNGSWDENYGAGGTADGPDIPLVLLEAAQLRFTYDHGTHVISAAPAAAVEPLSPDDAALVGTSLREDLTRERFYFVMADRFENGDATNDTGDFPVPPGTPPEDERLHHGYDPTDQGFFHGGDLRGIIDRLDYIEGLGTTAIWLTPSFKNKPVQGAEGDESAGYHGYWITDFTSIDPHLGTNEDMAELVEEAHARGLKVFFDIITNHTADVVTYDRDMYDASGNLPYVSTTAEPYRDAAGVDFDDRDFADGSQEFPEVNLDSFPYRPLIPDGEEEVKVPGWLNLPTMYHNRGTSTFSGESDTYGDFPSGPYSALDDLWTERPEVVEGMIDIYQTWVGEVGIDGFRIDTVKHVNMEFWQQFGPALQGYAASLGNDDFFMFGEIFDTNPAFVSQYTTEGRLQAAVDFGFQGASTAFAKGAGTTGLRNFFASDDWYTDDDSNAYSLPTFLGNHDMGRIGSFLRQNSEGWDDAQLLARDRLAHSLMYLTRGQPVVYYGDEQGFSAPPDVPGGIGDRRARENMFPSQVELYNSFDLIGTDATTAKENFDEGHPLYQHIGALASLQDAHPALADGAQIHRFASNDAGVYAFSRVDADERREYVVAVNNATGAETATFATFSPRATYQPVWPQPGRGPRGHLRSDAEGRVTVTVPPLSAVVYRAVAPIRNDRAVPEPFFRTPTPGGVVGGRAEIGVGVPGGAFNQATLAWRPVGAETWAVLGVDDNAPYRVFHDVRGLARGTMVEYRAVVKDADGDLGVAQTYGVVGDPPRAGGGSGGGPVVQPQAVSVPGQFQVQVGCPSEWEPACEHIALTLDEEDLVWSRTFDGEQTIPAGQYAYKVALNGTWDENYGVGAVRDGPNIEFTADGGPVTFYYSHATNWVTNSVETPHLFTAPGSFQSELGCPEDWEPDCLRSWLQDPDGDGVWTFLTTQIPAGSYEVKVAQDQSWDVNWGADGVPDGPNIGFSVGDSEGVEMSFDEATKVLTVATFLVVDDGGGPDLSTSRAAWLTPEIISWDLPEDRRGWTYRLHWGPAGSLTVDSETIGGSSIPLTLDPSGLPAALAQQYPDLADAEVLRLTKQQAKDAVAIAAADELAVAAYDDLGRLVQATGVMVVGDLGPGKPAGTPGGGAPPGLGAAPPGQGGAPPGRP
jgi:glycosidase